MNMCIREYLCVVIIEIMHATGALLYKMSKFGLFLLTFCLTP